MSTTSHLPHPHTFLAALLDSLSPTLQPPSQSPRSTAIASSALAAHPNPLTAASPLTKAGFVTLHALFPTDLLPALSLLDQRLITRLNPAAQTSPGSSVGPTPASKPDVVFQTYPFPNHQTSGTYYVRSAHPALRHPRRGRPRATDAHAAPTASADTSGPSYEVRTRAWNCTCPAFAFAALRGGGLEAETEAERTADVGKGHGDVEGHGHGHGHGHVAADGRARGPGHERGLDDGAEWRFGGARRRGAPVCKHLLACVLAERCGLLGGFVEGVEMRAGEEAGWAAGWGG